MSPFTYSRHLGNCLRSLRRAKRQKATPSPLEQLVRLGIDPRTATNPFLKRLLGPVTRAYVRQLGVPVIAITGTNGKTTVTRLLDRVLREAGYRVGMACTDGVTRHGRWLATGDSAGVLGVARAVRGGDVDVLVAETARGGMIKHGFGFECCQVAVVTNVSEDHLGIDGVHTVDQMAEVKAGLLERLTPSGAAVLNLDDPQVAAMARRVRGPVISFSMQRPPPGIRHCLYLYEGAIYRREAEREAPVIAEEDVAITRGGLLRYNLLNAMAVLAALDGVRATLPVADAVARDVLATSGRALEETPFALRLLDLRGGHVLVSHSKNPAGFEADLASLAVVRRSRGYEKVVGLMTHLGDRPPDFLRALAAAAATSCDHLMAIPPMNSYLRGRSARSLTALLEEGIPTEKRLPNPGGDCAAIIAQIRKEHPEKTLFAIFNARLQRGIMDILREGREISGDLPSCDRERRG